MSEKVFIKDFSEANRVRQLEWDTGTEKVSLSFRGLELAGEVGEACNIMKKLERERMGLIGSNSNVESLAEELADVLICVELIALQFGLDMDREKRLKFNKTSNKYGLNTYCEV